MILNFKPQFLEPILIGSKVHTIREDKFGRWKNGRVIHFSIGSRTKNCFVFKQGEVKGIQRIKIDPYTRNVYIVSLGRNIALKPLEIEILAQNDGFTNSDDFFAWFNTPFVGKLIMWTKIKPYGF